MWSKVRKLLDWMDFLLRVLIVLLIIPFILLISLIIRFSSRKVGDDEE